MDVQKIPVAKVRLDERNPRIAHTLEGLTGAATADFENFIEIALGQNAPDDEERASTTYSSLKESIRASKGLILPIIVSPRDDGTYLVIEGNTRVAIYRELAEGDKEGDWSHIPAIIQSMDEAGEHAIRLQAHLVGPRPWRPYAKAKYLYELYHDHKLAISDIHAYCGGSARRREIEQYIAAYRDMQQYYMPLVEGSGRAPDYSRFSAFVELQKQPNLKQAIARAGYTLTDFGRWLNDPTKLTPLQGLRHLDRVLANPEAKREFEKHNLREAIKVLERPSSNAVISGASMEQLARALAAKIRALGWPDVQALMADPAGATAEALVDCADEIADLTKHFDAEPRDE
jgi:hypothetical protein